MAELLLAEGYEVFGIVRENGTYEHLDPIRDRIALIRANLLDESSLARALHGCEPHEVYNLASPSFVPTSWHQPVLTAEFAAVGATALIEAIRLVCPEARFYQASSSEIFGNPAETPQNEQTPLSPLTPYGVAKAYAHFITGSYRSRYGLFACSGILYNHESPRRPTTFVTRKISHGAASIALGHEHELVLGDLDARRDWGYAGDYVRAIWLMLQQDEPGDYVVASGVMHSVRELVECAFAYAGLDWERHVRIDESLKRGKAELHSLVGDATKARESLGWSPSVDFDGLVRLLVDADLGRLRAAEPGAVRFPASTEARAEPPR